MTSNKSQSWLKPEQVEAMREACYSRLARNCDRNDAMIALFYDSGLRPGELVQLTADMFDADASCLRIPGSMQKDYPTQASPQAVTIGLEQDEWTDDTVKTVKSYLKSRDSESMFLFPSPDNGAPQLLSLDSIRYTAKTLAERAEIRPYIGQGDRGEPSDVIPYSFRHSIAYRILECRENGTLYDVRKRLRHQSVQTTEDFYLHFDRV